VDGLGLLYKCLQTPVFRVSQCLRNLLQNLLVVGGQTDRQTDSRGGYGDLYFICFVFPSLRGCAGDLRRGEVR
jgi:hypothetical protein